MFTELETVCHISINGTDCRIEGLNPFNSQWYSHKMKAPECDMKSLFALELPYCLGVRSVRLRKLIGSLDI